MNRSEFNQLMLIMDDYETRYLDTLEDAIRAELADCAAHYPESIPEIQEELDFVELMKSKLEGAR